MPLAAPTKSNQENSFIQTKVEAGEFWYKISSVFETKRKFRPKSVVTSQKWLNPVFKTLGQARCRAWDLVHGVDTCGEIPLLDLDFENEHKTPGLEYQSHHPAIIRDGLMSLNIPCQDYAFVDFGCGKGRVLLVASEFPFRRITGVEFAPQLADTAKRNLQTYRAKNQKCFELEVITADASEYELAHEPQVLYFYSPFARSVMDRVVRNIEASLQKSPRDLLILFSGVLGMRESAFGSRPQYERLKRGRYIDIYRHRRR
jgi:SAM-dependent methyltransferase